VFHCTMMIIVVALMMIVMTEKTEWRRCR